MSEPRPRPTAADVARRSGVSSATVSYVLNDTPGQTISPGTRERVLAAAAELGYVQHSAAATLARGRSRVVLLDMSDLPHGVVADDFARSFAELLDRSGFTPLLSWWSRDDSGTKLIQLARAVMPLAVVTIDPLAAQLRRELQAMGVRTIAGLGSDGSEVRTLVARAAGTQVDYLHERGCRSVRYAPPPEARLAELGVLRRDAAAAAARRHRLGFGVLPATADLDELAAALRAAAEDGADAIACYNDEVAMRVLSAVRRAGLGVPTDLAVMGVDDLPLAELTVPTLTTLRSEFWVAEQLHQFRELMLATDGSSDAFDIPMRQRLVRRESA